MRRRALVWLLVCMACTEDPTAPGTCPAFCPPGDITLVDTVLTSVVVRDSAFRGYLQPHNGAVLIAANTPGTIDSRPIMRFQRAIERAPTRFEDPRKSLELSRGHRRAVRR